MMCERCGKKMSSTLALHDHLNTKGACKGKKPSKGTGVVMETGNGITEVKPHGVASQYME